MHGGHRTIAPRSHSCMYKVNRNLTIVILLPRSRLGPLPVDSCMYSEEISTSIIVTKRNMPYHERFNGGTQIQKRHARFYLRWSTEKGSSKTRSHVEIKQPLDGSVK